MSGTSADGIDAALVRTDGDEHFEFIDFVSLPYTDEFRDALLACARGEASESVICNVEMLLTDHHADCVNELRAKNPGSEVELVGFHGHTIAHAPAEGITRQIGDGQRLADATGTDVVFDFRTADVDAGGQGAPLVPLFHAMLFRHQPKPTVVLNIGGVANITSLGSNNDEIIAGDTGPGCGLLDAWVASQTGKPFDLDGSLALNGKISEPVVMEARSQPWFQKPLPKSADRFDFDSINVSELSPEDGAATLCAVTASTVADAVRRLGDPVTTWVSGGGSRHPLIMRLLADELGDVRPIEDCGLRSDSLEAECFAWLAVRHLRNLPTSLPTTTGCRQPTCGGRLARPRISRNV